MPEIRFTEEDHAFAQEFVDCLDSSGVAGTVREFLSKEDADWVLADTERALRNNALMSRLAGAMVRTMLAANLAEPAAAVRGYYGMHLDNFGYSRDDEDVPRWSALDKCLPPNPDEDAGGSVVIALMNDALAEMSARTLPQSEAEASA